jgi:hypothetical protein
MHIKNYILKVSDLVEKYKGSPYVPQSIDVHKLCTSVFKPVNMF